MIKLFRLFLLQNLLTFDVKLFFSCWGKKLKPSFTKFIHHSNKTKPQRAGIVSNWAFVAVDTEKKKTLDADFENTT